MNAYANVKLLFAYQDGVLKSVKDFYELRGAKQRPTDLVCPECQKQVTVKLSPQHQVADHFAHYPDSDCPLRGGGESATHLNAKAGLALWLSRYHKMALSFKCDLCTNWDTFFKIEDYDNVIPELKIGKRRPDISVLNSQQPIGAAEIMHTHAVCAEKQYDLNALGLQWFEIPASGAHRKFYNAHAIDGEWFTIDAQAAGVTFPNIPRLCRNCTEHKRREAERLERWRAEQFLKRQEEDRWAALEQEKREAAIANQMAQWKESRIAAAKQKEEEEAARLKVEQENAARLAEQERIEKAARDIWEQEAGPAFINASNDLIIPTRSIYKYRYWAGGQSVFKTLEELGAGIATWKNYARRDEGLLGYGHAERCKGEVKSGNGFYFCSDCGYWLEAAKEAA